MLSVPSPIGRCRRQYRVYHSLPNSLMSRQEIVSIREFSITTREKNAKTHPALKRPISVQHLSPLYSPMTLKISKASSIRCPSERLYPYRSRYPNSGINKRRRSQGKISSLLNGPEMAPNTIKLWMMGLRTRLICSEMRIQFRISLQAVPDLHAPCHSSFFTEDPMLAMCCRRRQFIGMNRG